MARAGGVPPRDPSQAPSINDSIDTLCCAFTDIEHHAMLPVRNCTKRVARAAVSVTGRILVKVVNWVG